MLIGGAWLIWRGLREPLPDQAVIPAQTAPATKAPATKTNEPA